VVRGQYAGYRDEQDVAKRSDVETFCALRLYIDSWRWEGVQWYLRSGKYLPDTATEVLVELKPAPQRLFADSAPLTGRSNYLRFRLSPDPAIALAARVKLAGQDFIGEQKELYLSEERSGDETPYERLLSDAMAGDGALFTREDAVEAAWQLSIRYSRLITAFAFTNAAVGGRGRLMRSSLRTTVGITPAARTHRDKQPYAAVSCPTRS